MKYLASLGWASAILVGIGALFGVFLLAVAIDVALRPWAKRRDEFIKNERLHRYNVAAFRGTRKFDDPRWPT
jgi:hypothetical protein